MHDCKLSLLLSIPQLIVFTHNTITDTANELNPIVLQFSLYMLFAFFCIHNMLCRELAIWREFLQFYSGCYSCGYWCIPSADCCNHYSGGADTCYNKTKKIPK